MNKNFCFFAFFFCIAVNLFAGGGRETSQGEIPEPERNDTPAVVVRITGRLRLVGNEPFTELVISTVERNLWYIGKNEEKLLYEYQQRNITVEGNETIVKLKFANGMDAGERRILSNIIIISVE